jgi:transposase
MIPPYKKPAAPKRKKKSGRPQGHPGSRRPVPPKIDQRVEHRLERCPDCGGELRPCTSENSTRTRIVEDIPADIQPVVTEHILHRDECPHCKKLVEPTVPDALPGATVGNHLLVLSAHWHYGLGMPVSQIVTVLNSHLHFPVSEGGLIQMWQRLADRFEPWYEQLIDQAYASAVLHADETSWRVKGKTHWLGASPMSERPFTCSTKAAGVRRSGNFSRMPTKAFWSPTFGRPTIPSPLARVNFVWRDSAARVGEGRCVQPVGGVVGFFEENQTALSRCASLRHREDFSPRRTRHGSIGWTGGSSI